jgi:hypothetical protein
MSLRSHFTSTSMHLLGWVGGRYGCHDGALVRIMGWRWGGIRAAWCKRLHMSGHVYSHHDTIKAQWFGVSYLSEILGVYLRAVMRHVWLANTQELWKDQTSQINTVCSRQQITSRLWCGRRVGACMRDADAWTWTWTLILVRGFELLGAFMSSNKLLVRMTKITNKTRMSWTALNSCAVRTIGSIK